MNIIKIENLSKKYIIRHDRAATGMYRYSSLRDSIAHTCRGIIQRIRHPLSPNTETTALEELWALKDINLEIKQGDKVGIIGRNGAGKSTLLKILSRITEPTTGKFTIKGRIASLLEVGTGFHPELSGRENIYLNGAILGMTRKEIKKKFDEIVDFSGIEKFLDTPVKRYSSGMYVRLAFAIAAHLDPEILLIDEALAVGDAEFQKKCLGKIDNVSKQGRTILFVSHNMAAIQSLCQHALLLENGFQAAFGNIDNIVKRYLSEQNRNLKEKCVIELKNPNQKHAEPFINYIAIKNIDGKYQNEFDQNTPLIIEVIFTSKRIKSNLNIGISIFNSQGIRVATFNSFMEKNLRNLKEDIQCFQCIVENITLTAGYYYLTVGILNSSLTFIYDRAEECLGFVINNSIFEMTFPEKDLGIVTIKNHWKRRYQ